MKNSFSLVVRDCFFFIILTFSILSCKKNDPEDLFGLLMSHKDAVTRVTFWGVHDGYSWKNDWPIVGRTNYPLLFDRNYKPKPAFYSVIKSVKL